MIDLILMEPPEHVQIPVEHPSGYQPYHVSVGMLPYFRPISDITEVLKRHRIRAPFDKVLSLADGTSTCSECGARYAGMQYMCSNLVLWTKRSGDYYWQRGVQRNYPEQIKYDACNSETKWSLRNEFDRQKRFFDFLELISSLEVNPNTLLSEFSDTLPMGSEDHYRRALTEQTVAKLVAELDRIQMVLQEVVNRMNSAGHSLTFR